MKNWHIYIREKLFRDRNYDCVLQQVATMDLHIKFENRMEKSLFDVKLLQFKWSKMSFLQSQFIDYLNKGAIKIFYSTGNIPVWNGIVLESVCFKMQPGVTISRMNLLI